MIFVYFRILQYLPKQNRKAINPHPGNLEGNKKDCRKHKQENKQGSIDRGNKTSSKYIDFRQTLKHKMKNIGKAEARLRVNWLSQYLSIVVLLAITGSGVSCWSYSTLSTQSERIMKHHKMSIEILILRIAKYLSTSKLQQTLE